MIFNYFKELKDTIEEYNHIVVSKITSEKTYSNKKGFVEGEILFIDDSRLDFSEVKDVEKQEKIKYSYHYMDNSNEMLFRYDNTKHYPNISTFPHHKHIQNRVLESKELELRNILYEIEHIIIRKKINNYFAE